MFIALIVFERLGRHAQNALYMDRNQGGVFIIWGRSFGSFPEEDEKEPVIFGVTTPLPVGSRCGPTGSSMRNDGVRRGLLDWRRRLGLFLGQLFLRQLGLLGGAGFPG